MSISTSSSYHTTSVSWISNPSTISNKTLLGAEHRSLSSPAQRLRPRIWVVATMRLLKLLCLELQQNRRCTARSGVCEWILASFKSGGSPFRYIPSVEINSHQLISESPDSPPTTSFSAVDWFHIEGGRNWKPNICDFQFCFFASSRWPAALFASSTLTLLSWVNKWRYRCWPGLKFPRLWECSQLYHNLCIEYQIHYL